MSSRVEQIERQIKQLGTGELKALRDWFLPFDAGTLDQEIEADAHNGKLLGLAESALRDYEAGRSTEL